MALLKYHHQLTWYIRDKIQTVRTGAKLFEPKKNPKFTVTHPMSSVASIEKQIEVLTIEYFLQG